MLPSKSSLVGDVRPSREMTVTFEIDEKSESDAEIPNQRQARKKAVESYVRHEIQSWSSFFSSSTTDQILPATDKRTNGQGFQRAASEERATRYQSALIGRKKDYHHHHHKVTWHSLFGTMFDVNEILMDKSLFRCLPCLQPVIILIDSCLRGVGQVMFANNPLSGLVSLE